MPGVTAEALLRHTVTGDMSVVGAALVPAALGHALGHKVDQGGVDFGGIALLSGFTIPGAGLQTAFDQHAPALG